MVGLDTSVVLRLLINEPVAQAKVAEEYLNQLFESGTKVTVSDLVVSETYFALQFHYKVPKGEAIDALTKLFQSKEIISSGYAGSVLGSSNSLANAKPGFVDRLIHAEYQNKQGEMATFEKKAGKLDGTIVLKAK